MELDYFDYQVEDAQDTAFEVEAESFITAVKEALQLEEAQLAELDNAVKAATKEVQVEEAVQYSKFVTESRELLNVRAADIMRDFRTGILKIVSERVDADPEFYQKYLKHMLAEGSSIILGETMVVCRQADLKYFEGETLDPTLSPDERGFILTSADSKVQVDMTLRRRVELVMHAKYPQLAGLLIADYRFIE